RTFEGPSEGRNRDGWSGSSTTVEISGKTFVDEIPIEQRAYLEILGAEGRHRSVELGEEEVLIGRSPDSDIQIREGNVSRIHSRITFKNEEYSIEDLDSTNGTHVNGVRVMKCILRANDQIEIGGVKMYFHEEKKLQKK
ncbi:MAG: FHA domain-containing protein, partial [Pseudomonadota bacterium]